MKKLLTILLALSMVFVMTACGDDSDDIAEMKNPITECSSVDELLEATGISLDAPEGATDVRYSYIDSGVQGESIIAQVEFTLDDNQFCYRAKDTAATSLYSAVETDEDADLDELSEMMEETIEGCSEFAGLYDEWKASASVDVAGTREGVVAFNEGKSGFIAWLDVVPGAMYSLSVTSGATQDLLMNTADKIFVPMQGDAE